MDEYISSRYIEFLRELELDDGGGLAGVSGMTGRGRPGTTATASVIALLACNALLILEP